MFSLSIDTWSYIKTNFEFISLCIVIWGTRLFDFVGLAVVDSGLGHPASSHAGSGNMPAVMLTKQLR